MRAEQRRAPVNNTTSGLRLLFVSWSPSIASTTGRMEYFQLGHCYPASRVSPGPICQAQFLVVPLSISSLRTIKMSHSLFGDFSRQTPWPSGTNQQPRNKEAMIQGRRGKRLR
ncbi:uncharacterized protein BDW70DRAFT_130307 [Aspergillus foveolatus]|uniref:uncharacterized protein n=1 Tax=Aspergillus foveolatus TaxID=210207 RepID=UPI003CCDF51C